MAKSKLLISATALIGVVFFFQNCQRARMATKGLGDASLAAVGVSDEDLNGLDNDNPPDDPNDPDDDDDDDLADNDDDDDDHDDDKDCSKDKHDRENGDRLYVCVIDGPGQSTRVGLLPNGDLQAQHEGPKLLCMTKAACEVTAAKAFKNPHAEFRGFCKNTHNKNVKHVSDANMILLVDKFLLENPNGPTSTGNNFKNPK